MGAKVHAAARSRKKDIILTALLCAAAFGTMLYIQGALNDNCNGFGKLTTVEELQSYAQRFMHKSDSTADNLLALSKQLTDLVDNSTRLATTQQQHDELQDELAQTQEELAAANQRVASLENQVKELHAVKEQLPSLSSKVEQHTKDLANTLQQMQQLKQQKDQLEKDKEQLESEKKQHEQQQKGNNGANAATSDSQCGQPVIPGSPHSSSALANAARLQALAAAGAECTPVQGYDFWGDPTLIWGYEHRAADAAECCAACHAHRQVVARGGTEKGRNSTSCSLWAFCGLADKCGTRFGECWLRGSKGLPAVPNLPKDANPSPGWVSGIIYDDKNAYLAAYNNTALVFTTKLGEVQIDLLPELAPVSVRELRRAATILAPSGHCSNCRIYRPEKSFLVQGMLEAPGVYVATPRHPNPPQRMVMERGLVCWAGGGGGPHWFVNMVNQSGFKDEHLCFGLVKNMTVFEAILELPVKQKKKPSDMNGLAEDLWFNVTLKTLDNKQ